MSPASLKSHHHILLPLTMLRNVLLVGFISAASAFVFPTPTLHCTPAGVPRVSANARSAVRMVDADLVASALPGLAALGLALQGQNYGDLSAVKSVLAEPAVRAPTEAEMLIIARENFQKWNMALQTKNPHNVAQMYSNGELSFLPTVSPQHIKQTDGTEQYFTEFVKKNPYGTITDDSVQVYDMGNSYLHSGMYTFELGESDARTPVKARFSYMWKKIDGDWKITHHHSSILPPAPDMLSVARENFAKWNAALQTKNPKAVAQLYAEEGLSFLPTVSPEHVKDTDNTEGYFVEFVKKNPFGTITDDSVTVFDDGRSYLHSGMYTFELGESDARKPVEARFSYVWRKFGSEWKITHHHSSMRPAA